MRWKRKSASETYKQYAADCMRLADGETTTEARDVMLNMALAWVRLAQQKQALMTGKPMLPETLPGSEPLDAAKPAPPRPH